MSYEYLSISYKTIYRAIYAGMFDTPEQKRSEGNRGARRKLRHRGKPRRPIFGGMRPEEYAAYTKKYLKKPVEGFSNLKIGEAYYLPMVEVLSYLRANGFKSFLVSGADREYTRVMAEVLPVDSDNILGTDYRFVAANQKGKDGMEYVFGTDDKVVRGEFEAKNINMNKVSVMAREIGKRPVLIFGASPGLASEILLRKF